MSQLPLKKDTPAWIGPSTCFNNKKQQKYIRKVVNSGSPNKELWQTTEVRDIHLNIFFCQGLWGIVPNVGVQI